MPLKILLSVLVCSLLIDHVYGQQPHGISLEQAKKMALEQNVQLLIQKERTVENQERVKEAKSWRYPILLANANYVYNGVSNDVTIPKGSLGNFAANNILVPDKDITLLKSQHNLYAVGVLAIQPIIDQGKINTGLKVASIEVEMAHTRVLQTEQELNQSVEKLYYGTLIAQKKEESIKINIELAKVKLYDEESSLLAGKTDSAVKTGLQADLAYQEEKLLEVTNERKDDEGDLAIMMGLSYSDSIILTEQHNSLPAVQSFEYYLQSGKSNNLDILLGQQMIQKASYNVTAAKNNYLPSLNAIAGYYNQSLISVLPVNNYFIGLTASWNIIDFGKRKAVLNESMSQHKQAELNFNDSKKKVDNEIFKAYRKVIQSRELLAATQKTLDYRRADYKLKKDHSDAGLILPKELLETRAALVKEEENYYSLQLTYRISVTALERLAGISK
jgi:outer membrane protein